MNRFFHPGRFRLQFVGLFEQIRDIRVIEKRPAE
jgi:hypothetical protein